MDQQRSGCNLTFHKTASVAENILLICIAFDKFGSDWFKSVVFRFLKKCHVQVAEDIQQCSLWKNAGTYLCV